MVSSAFSSCFWSTAVTRAGEAVAVGEGGVGMENWSTWLFSMREESELIAVRVWMLGLRGVRGT